MTKLKHAFKLSALSDAETSLLNARLISVRAAISHAPEKGRVLEHETKSFLRSFLPTDYGLSTGFIAYHGKDGPRLSKQLDIIIYDAARGSPLVTLSTCDVFPIECVYGYVEVKARLDSGSTGKSTLGGCLRDNVTIRKMRERRYWAAVGNSPPTCDPWTDEDAIPIRSYIVAFETSTSLQPATRLAQRLATLAKQIDGAHIHGIYSPDSGFAYMRGRVPGDADTSAKYQTDASAKYGSVAFKAKMLKDLMAFGRIPDGSLPAIEQYFDFVPTINKFMPEDDLKAD